MASIIINPNQKFVERDNPFPVYQAGSGAFYAPTVTFVNASGAGVGSLISIPGAGYRRVILSNIGTTSGNTDVNKAYLGDSTLSNVHVVNTSAYALPSGSNLDLNVYAPTVYGIAPSGTRILATVIG